MKRSVAIVVLAIAASAAHSALPDSPLLHIRNDSDPLAPPFTGFELWCVPGTDTSVAATLMHSFPPLPSFLPGTTYDYQVPSGTLADGKWTCQVKGSYPGARSWTNWVTFDVQRALPKPKASLTIT